MDVIKASSVRTSERHLYRLSFVIIGNVTTLWYSSAMSNYAPSEYTLFRYSDRGFC